MNPPPDKKRKTGEDEYKRGASNEEDDEQWEDWTDDQLDIIMSQTEGTTEQLRTPSVPAASSSGFSRSFVRPAAVPPTKPRQCSTLSTRHAAGEPHFAGYSQSVSDDIKARLEKTEQDLAESKQELDVLKDDLLTRDGEIAMQKDTIKRKEAEIHRYKQEKMRQIDVDRQERSYREKEHKGEVDRMEGQIQFKTQEVLELQSKCRQLESQISRLEAPSTSSGGTTPARLSTHSPRLQPVLRKSPRKSPQSDYPSVESFQAKSSPRPGISSKEKSTNTDVEVSVLGTGQSFAVRRPLTLATSNGLLNGPCLVGKILEGERTSGHAQSVGGIVRLLQPFPVPPINFASVSMERDANSLLFSPKTFKRSSGSQRLTQGSESVANPDATPTSPGLIAAESLSLAVRGLTEMLGCNRNSLRTSNFTTTSADETPSESPAPHNAIFVLPLLDSYLGHYLEMLSIGLDDSNLSSPNNSLRTGNTNSSDGSSFDSVSSSLNLLLKDGATYANNLEELCIAALKVLEKLISHCPEAVLFILRPRPLGSSQDSWRVNGTVPLAQPMAAESTSQQGEVSKEDHPSSEELSAPSSGASSVSSVIKSPVSDINILRKVIQLADPGNGSTVSHNQLVVELSLNVLHCLSESASAEQLERLWPLLTLGVFHNCLMTNAPPSIVLRSLRVLSRVIQCQCVTNALCTAPDGCLLRCLYSVCSNPTMLSQLHCCDIYNHVMDCVSFVASARRGSCDKPPESNCPCRRECVKATSILIHALLRKYTQSARHSVKATPSQSDILALIKRGVAFLHFLAQHDPMFTDHHDDIDHSYVGLVCGLMSVYNNTSDITENDLSAIHELWDFDQDDWDLSQEEENGMEVG